jgi:nitrogen regulatory protein P-II 1
MMKVEAIIRPERLNDVKDALARAGSPGLTAYEVKGRGRQMGYTLIFRGKEQQIDLLPKMKIELVIKDEDLDKVVELIQQKAFTGNIGDGKIFTYRVSEVMRVRTGEKGENAL